MREIGLDITVYEHVKKVEEVHELEDEEGNVCYKGKEWGGLGHVRAFQDVSFYHANGGLEPDACYEPSGRVKRFRAGSYGGYNHFRNELAEAALGVPASTVWEFPETYKDKPFFELINFSDCEGFIGPEVCQQLAHDFKAERERVYPQLDSTWNQAVYDNFEDGFALAARDGMVDFH